MPECMRVWFFFFFFNLWFEHVKCLFLFHQLTTIICIIESQNLMEKNYIRKSGTWPNQTETHRICACLNGKWNRESSLFSLLVIRLFIFPSFVFQFRWILFRIESANRHGCVCVCVYAQLPLRLKTVALQMSIAHSL